jgi:hypothetical protein
MMVLGVVIEFIDKTIIIERRKTLRDKIRQGIDEKSKFLAYLICLEYKIQWISGESKSLDVTIYLIDTE